MRVLKFHRVPTRRFGSRLAAAALMGAVLTIALGLPVTSVGPIAEIGAAPAAAAGVNLYSQPEWLPLRTTTGVTGGADLRIGCTYLSPDSICGGHHSYWALDMAVQQGGTPIFAAGAGQVTTYPMPNSSGYGNYIVVNHGSFGRTLYGHMAGFSVANGAWVDQNTQLGIVGNTGNTGGTYHLHFEYNDGVGGSDDPGPLKACHGSNLVTYDGWQGLSWGARFVSSDGTACTSTDPTITYTIGYTAAEQTRMLQSAAHFGKSPQDFPKWTVIVFDYLLLISNPRAAPTTPVPPAVDGTVSYTTTWDASELPALEDFRSQFGLAPVEAQKFAVILVNFLLALDGK